LSVVRREWGIGVQYMQNDHVFNVNVF